MKNNSSKYSTIHYHNYLKLDDILNAQVLRSEELEEPAHEEMLFIVIHQIYELWFKQIIHELQSVLKLFNEDKVDERFIGTAVGRLQRIEEILKVLIQQINVLETMTPLDFLDFRSYLFPASGFQSFQFRLVECLLGLPEESRITYNNYHYASAFSDEQQEELKKVYVEGSLFDAVENWLERTPFLKLHNFDFINSYGEAVLRMIDKEQQAIKKSEGLTGEEKMMRIKLLGDTDTYFQSILDRDLYETRRKAGKLRLSYEATTAALFIHLYREQPILHLPFRLLINLVDIDQLLTSWRYRHAQMVLRMIGRKIGTGGSAGHKYLSATAEKHHVFMDLHNISTLLIPRSDLPKLPEDIEKQLSFYFTNSGS